ncbi:glycosyltransferase family 2 protein [Companilactobacillus nodensis]|uniref:Glycosyltransferase, involved in cell wall biogenesis n=1 Tax=Companilactobacillus nodensis DSM 19682 = JCM 14932 = NBRC 107160 TaxID=1423775 RepID=A0A0R1K6F8_9LACO|nr:glycosyltransferase family 2 protein [Companilactobacillus nodensis]KRK79197.1 Glycosyltransferase, involved in cell wall biogenesis [Companilactobacillus nodensis DSM 19682 = JCM 14932 = NBRC 107160]
MKWTKKLLYAITVISTVIYLVWRTFFTIPFHTKFWVFLFAILLLLSEIISNFSAFVLIWNKRQVKEYDKPKILPEEYPDIDVLIATHNEPPDLLMKTINACTFMRYPDKNKVHIYVSDDANRPEIKELAKKYHVNYMGIADNKDAKAGNYNYTLARTHSRLIATFDADMIPYSEFLLETVPYFVQNEKEGQQEDPPKDWQPIGLVQTPQSFYNADIFQYNLFSENSIPNEQDYFSREVNVLNNAHGAAIYTGSNTVLSRAAIEAAGGFPTDTITEDFELSMRINAQGFKNISTIEPMASGLTPVDFKSVMKQRIRWARGVIQSIYNLKVPFNPDLTGAQKLIYMNSYFYWWAFPRRFLYIFAPVLYALFKIRVVDADFWVLLAIWAPSYFLVQLVLRNITGNIRTQRWGEIQETVFAPYLFFPVILESFGIKAKTFKVTNKEAKTSKKDIIYVLPYLIMWLIVLVSIIKFNYGKFGSEIMYGSVITFWLLMALINLSFAVLLCLGRPIYRRSERFSTSIDIKVSQGNNSYDLKTTNTSEEGLSFISKVPLYFPGNSTLNFTLKSKHYEAHLQGKVVRAFETRNGWMYGITLKKPDFKNDNEYLQIIHDGFNRYLPQKRDPWDTALDELMDNFDQRFNKKEVRQSFTNEFPMVQVNQRVNSKDQEFTLTTFNFETLTLAGTSFEKLPDNLSLFLAKGITLKLTANQETTSNQRQYKVDNLEELLQNKSFVKILDDWGGKQ